MHTVLIINERKSQYQNTKKCYLNATVNLQTQACNPRLVWAAQTMLHTAALLLSLAHVIFTSPEMEQERDKVGNVNPQDTNSGTRGNY